jgi:lipoprotein-anchoring transpeptidase ErfK/SrfK
LRSIGSSFVRNVAVVVASTLVFAGLASVAACKKKPVDAGPASSGSGATAAPPSAGPSGDPLALASAVPQGPTLAAVALTAWIYQSASKASPRLGYLRSGAIVGRSDKSEGSTGCPGGWYEIKPYGHVCAGEYATTDLENPVVKVTKLRRPDLTKPMPYRYAFVRSVSPQYLKIPSKEEQLQYEFKLENHLRWYKKHEAELAIVTPGANDVPELDRGKPVTVSGPMFEGVKEAKGKKGKKGGKESDEDADEASAPPPPEAVAPLPPAAIGDAGLGDAAPALRPSRALSLLELLGADTATEPSPWWLQGGERKIPHLSAFIAPKYAIIAARVKRHTGLAFIDAFTTGAEGNFRQFAVTTDLRLVPASKLKPNTGSQWHGVELAGDFTLPLAFAHANAKEHKSTRCFRIDGASPKEDGELVFRQAVALTGKDKTVGGTRYFEMKDGRWLRKNDIIIARKPDEWPAFAKGSQKWIDLSVMKQTLILFEGDKPVYATLVSTGQDGIGDPKTTKSTVRGVFKIRDKHVTTTMDANEVDNKFELRDVPWVQYFEAGYALHAAYWHDEYGTPRSHGCVNLSPIDARKVFFWTDPQLPPGWHSVSAGDEAGKGTIINSHI